jgi:deoxyadenosine/deoxycytidine kinase
MEKEKRVYVEGNIGAGKSTFMNELSSKYPDIFASFPEENGGRAPFLRRFYENMKQGSFALQTKILFDQVKYPYVSGKINLYERSPISLLNIFGEMLYNDGLFSEYEFKLHKEMVAEFSPEVKVIVYIDTPTRICHERKNKRREGKTADDLVPYDYMKELGEKYSEVIQKIGMEKKIKIIPIYYKYDIEIIKDEIVKVFS